MVPISDHVDKIDTIEHEGRLWLVPIWIDLPQGQGTMPLRLIPLDRLPHQKSNAGEWDFVVSKPIPKELLYEAVPSQIAEQYGVVEHPNIRIPVGGGYH